MTGDEKRRLTLDMLPEDILLIVLQELPISTFASLTRTCRSLHAFVEGSGWKAYAAAHPVPSPSLMPAIESSRWTTVDLLRHQSLAENAWKERKYVVRPLGPEWTPKLHPLIAISSSRLVVAAGNALFVYKFTPPSRRHSELPRTIFEYTVTFPKDARKDCTGIAFVPDGSENRTLALSFANGALCRVRIPPVSENTRKRNVSIQALTLTYLKEYGNPIQSMSAVGNAVLTMDSAGVASLCSLSDQIPTPMSTVDVGVSSSARGWSAHLALQSSSGYAVLGTASHTPLVVHSVTESSLNPFPQAILSPSAPGRYSPASAAVYSICGATQTFPWASASNQIIMAGWYHGIITLHDLRCPTRHASTGSGPSLAPVLTLRDPMALSPIYSLSSTGAHIASGSAQYSLIQLYDVRSPQTGWSIYLPQSQRGHSTSSPVYSCLLEGTRIWAATESRAFVVDFGQGINERTFPALYEREPGPHSTSGFGWPVTFYEHDMFMRERRGSWRNRENEPNMPSMNAGL